MLEREKREQHTERNIILPDFKTVEPVDILPESVVEVPLGLPSGFHELVSTIELTSETTAYWHGRSFLARRGLAPCPHIDPLDFIKQAIHQRQSSVAVPVENFSSNTFTLLEGSGVCTIGIFLDAPLTGHQLEKAVKKQEVAIYGRDWRYFLDEHSGEPIGIEMDINPDVQKVMGNFPDTISLNGYTGRNHGRDIDGYYHRVAKPSDDSQLWFGTTISRIYLPKTIDGVIVGIRERGGTVTGDEDMETEHVNSRILQGNRTGRIEWNGHPIITEIIGPTEGVERAQSICIKFHRRTGFD